MEPIDRAPLDAVAILRELVAARRRVRLSMHPRTICELDHGRYAHRPDVGPKDACPECRLDRAFDAARAFLRRRS